MDVEWWKTFFEVGGVALLFLTFAFGAGFMLTGKMVNDRQSERLRNFEGDLTAAKTNLEVQKERAATAEGKIAGLQKGASDAKKAEQEVGLELAKQKEKAAKAEAALFELQRERLPRSISIESIEFLKGRAVAGNVEIMYKRDDPEAAGFAEWVWAFLASNGWNATKPVSIPSDISADKVVEVLGAQPLGVTVVTQSIPDNPKRDDAFSVLVDFLVKSLRTVYGGRSPSALPAHTTRIIVMQKP